MKHINPMKYINTMKHIITISYRKSLICALTLLLCMIGVTSSYARYYEEGEKFYLNSNVDFNWKNDGAYILIYLQNEDHSSNWWVHLSEENGNIFVADMPSGDWKYITVVRKSKDENGWGDVWNQTKDLTISTVSEHNCLDFFKDMNNPDNPLYTRWKTYTPQTSKIPSVSDLKASGIVEEHIKICPDALNGPFSLRTKINASGTAYDYDNAFGHGWYKSTNNGTTWESIDGYAGYTRDGEGDKDNLDNTLPASLGDSKVLYYYQHTARLSGRRLIKITADADNCDPTCEITSFELAVSAVNVDDNTFTLDGMVAFEQAEGKQLVIECDGHSTTIDAPVSPEVFSITGIAAATKDGEMKEVRAYFWDGAVASCNASTNVDVPNATAAGDTTRVHILAGQTATLTPSDAVSTNTYNWRKEGVTIDGASQTYTTIAKNVDDVSTYDYREYNPISGSMDDMMSNGNYSAAKLDDPDAETIYGKRFDVDKSYVSDYLFWGQYDKSEDVNFYDNLTINPKIGYPGHPTYESNGFAVVQNANKFFKTYANVTARGGDSGYFGLFDAQTGAAGGNKRAWFAVTDDAHNPQSNLRLKKGTTYLFSFWAANINNYGEMMNPATLQFKIKYTVGDVEYTADLGTVLDLGSSAFLNNNWHQRSATFKSDYNADKVEIMVMNTNTNEMITGNDFALDDIQFHAISTVSRTVKEHDVFVVATHEPAITEFTATPNQMACNELEYAVDLQIKYKNQPGKLIVKDTTDGGDRKVWDTTLVALSEPIDISVTGATWDEEKAINRRVIQEIASADPVSKKRTYKVYFEDWTSAKLTDDFNDPVIPVLDATNDNNPAAILPCDQLTYTLSGVVSYRNMTSDKVRVWVDGASYELSPYKQELKDIAKETSTKETISYALKGIPADSLEHTLHVECAGLGAGCFDPVTFRAPFSPKVVTPLAISVPSITCSSPTTYTATVDVTTENHRNATLSAKMNGGSPVSKVVKGDVTRYVFENLKADGGKDTVTVYFDYVHGTLSECDKTQIFDAPFRPVVETITCEPSSYVFGALTYDVTVKVTTSNYRKNGALASLTVASTDLGAGQSQVSYTAAVDADGKWEHKFTGLKAEDGATRHFKAYFNDLPACYETGEYTSLDARNFKTFTILSYGDVDCEGNYKVYYQIESAALDGDLLIKEGDDVLKTITIDDGDLEAKTFSGSTHYVTLSANGSTHTLTAVFADHTTYTKSVTAEARNYPTIEFTKIGDHSLGCDGIVTVPLKIRFTNQTTALYIDSAGVKIKTFTASEVTGAPTVSGKKQLTWDWKFTADNTAHTLTAYFDGRVDCNPSVTQAAVNAGVFSLKQGTFTAPACNITTYTLHDTILYRNMNADPKIWLDGVDVTPAGLSVTKNNTSNLKKPFDLTITADSLEHTLKVTFDGRGAGCESKYTFRAPFMPHIESVNVSGLDAKSCGGSATYTATVTVNTSNQRNEAICVSLNGGTPQKKNPTGTSTVFTFTDLPANGSSNTVKAWFKCVGESCNQTETFTAPTLPKASVVLPASMPTVAACDQPTFDLTFDLKYTYQDGELQVWVARAGDATKYGLKTFTASLSDGDGKYIKLDKDENTKNITLTGLPSDGRSDYKLYFKFNESGYCGYSSPIETALLTFPRSPTIDSVRVTGVPSKVADCTVDKYIAYVKVWYRYTSGEDLIIRYTDNAGVAHIEGPFTLVGNPHNQSVTLNDIGKGSKELYAYFFGSDCQTTPQHTGEYVAPSNSAINGDYKVRVKENKSTCGNLLYDLTGTITYEGDATANLVVKFDNKDSVIIAQSACSGSGTTFVIPNLTKAVKNKTLIAYFLDQPKCTAASDKFDSPDTCRYDVPTASMSYSPAVCGETLTSLTFNLTYTYQSGTLKYWRDASDKKTATFKTNNDTTFTIEGLTLGGFPADSMTHKFYVQFEGGRCPDVKEFTTPEASFSPKVSNFKLKEITNELCNFDTYSAVVTFDVQNGQNKYIVAECKGKSAKRQIPSDGSYSLQIDGITRANPLNDFEVIRLYFPSADICSPNDTIRFKEKPKPALVKIEVDAAPETTCDKTEYILTGRLGYRNIKATPRVWLDDVSSDDKKTALDGYKSGFSTDEYIEFQLTVPADGKTHTVHADVTGWECAITPVDHDALWRPAVKDVKWTAPEFVYCDEPYDVKLEIEYERGVTGKNIYAWCTDHSAKIESSAALANGTGKATITLSNLTDRDNGWHNLTIYFEGMEASCPITSYKYNAPKTKTLTLGAPTANTVECGDPAFSITGSVTSNVTSGVVIVTDGTHSDEFDLASRTTYTISGLTTGGSLTAQFKGHNCSKTDAKTFSAVALKPIPTFSLKDITPQCYPAKEFAIGYEHTNAQTIVYTVNSGDEQSVDVNASNEFTINTTGWADGEYTITASAVSADDCPSASSSIKKLIIRKQPKISIEQLDDACDDASSTALKVKTTAAISYNYYIVGETQLLATPVTVAADGEYTPGLNIGMLNVGDAAKTYTLKMVANSENCVSDTVRKDFTIYPLPKLSFEDIEPACYPASSVEVTYNPTNVKEFRYTVKTKDGSDTKISNQLVTVGATKQFTITTDGWAAGEYTLTAVTTSTSEKGCTANATSVDFTILAKPTAEITKILNQCDNEGTTTVTYKAANATKFIYKIEGVMSDWSSEEDVELDGSGTGTFSLSISALNVGETAKEYTVKFKTKSASCESDETSGKFTIYPLPTLTITNTTINTCYPTETTLVPYTSKNAATYTYTLSGNGISPLSETKSAEASGNIPVNTDGLAAGTYDLNVTAKSAATAGSCDIATVATGTIIIQAQPTASIVDIADQCDYVDDITVEFSAENASEFRYKIDGEPNWSSWAGIPASNKFSLDISGLNVGDVKTKYTLMLETKKGSCTSETATKDFYILPIPTVTFNPSAIIIRTDVENVDVKLSFTNATTFDYSFVDEDNNVILDQKATGVTVSSNPLSLNLNTKDIGKGTYILKVTPHSTCEGTPNTLDVIVNDKPSIDFPGELVECEGTEDPMSVGYMASYDAKRLTYSIEKKEGDVYSPLVAEQTITLADYPSPFSIDVKNLVYGTYYISGYVVSLNPDESVLETGDLIRKEFSILAKPQENKVTQDVKFIGCGEEYSAKIVVNTFNAVGRTIIAEYSDNGGNHKLTDVAGAETATFDLSGLKDVGSTAGQKKTVTISIDGVGCGIPVEYEMPQGMTITNFTIDPQPKSCDETQYTVTGTVTANCNEGTIVVEYDATYKDEVAANTTGTSYSIANIPAGGVSQLKAYFKDKGCEPIVKSYDEPSMPEASIIATPPATLDCDVTTFDLPFTLNYTYQEEGTLTVWVEDFPEKAKTFTSAGGGYTALDPGSLTLNGKIEGLPADGRTGKKLYYTFDGTNSCDDEIALADFPNTPVIDSVKVVKDKEYIEGLTAPYYPTVTVYFNRAQNQKIVIEYYDDENNIVSHTDTSKYAVSGTDSYTFDDLTFNDAAVPGKRYVHAYFEGSACTSGKGADFNHDGEYTAPTNCSIKFESIDPLINRSTCDHLSYDLTGKVSFVGVARGDLIVELTLDGKTFSGKIDHALCVPDTELPFEIKNITKPIPDGGTQLTAYFLDLKTNTTILDYNVSTPVIPTVKVENATYSTPQCNESVTSLTFDLKYIKQQGNLRLFLDGVECYDYTIQTGAPLSHDDDTEQTATIVIEDLPADLSVRDLWVWFDGATDCKPNFTMPQAPYSPKVTSAKAEMSDVTCDKDTYTLNVSFTVENSQGKDATLVFRGESVNVSTTDGTNYSHSFNNVARTYGDVTDDVVELSFAGNNADCSGALYSIAYTETPKPAISLTLAADQGTTTCSDRTYRLQGEIRYTYLDQTPEIWLDEEAHRAINVQTMQADEQVINLAVLGINVPADGREHHVYIKPNGWADACSIDVPFNALQQPVITAAEVSGVPAFISCDETYSAAVTVDYVHAFGKTITVACTDNGSIQTYTSAAITDNDGQTVITLPSLSDHDGLAALSIYIDDETCAYTSASITQPKLNTIAGGFAVNVSTTPCGVVDYAVWGTIKFNNAVGLGELIVKTEDGVQAAITNQTATSADFRIDHYTVEGAAMQLTAYFSNWSDCKVQSDYFSSPDVPDLTLDDTAVDTVFTCGDKSYTVRVAFTATNQSGTGYLLDSIANGAVRTVETINATDTAAQFNIARPAKAEQHFVVVRYPATCCEVISQALDINPYTKPKPLISLTAIDRLCNNETELILPLVITQGDIDEATLTLTNSKGVKVITAADMSINVAHDTLSYNLPAQLAAGKYTAIVEARDTLDCETSASQSIEFALDGVVFSKWTDVLLVDNEGGLFTGYQWYENGKLLEGKTDQVLYLPEGMSGKSYYCVLQTAEGAIYTCVSDFGDLPRSADNPKTQSANHITVLPNRVATNGAVTVRQSLDENLHLILMSATGKRVAEYTQQEATKLIDMPGVQGIYLLRIESDSDVQTVKIVVY